MIRLLAWSTALFSQSIFASSEFLLADIDAGVAPAPVILFADAPPKTRQAALELVDYVEKVSGQRPKFIEGVPKQLPQRAVWVGYQAALDELFPKLDFDFEHHEEILIAATENHVVIAGRDRWDPDHLTVNGIDEMIIGVQNEYGTVNAVYTFLHDYLDIRWLWPGELGEDVPQRTRIVLKPFEHRYYPQFRGRGGTLRFSMLSNKGYGRSHQWSRRQRLQLDSLRVEGGHSFVNWHVRHFETNPELFALQPDGTRGSFPAPRKVKLCQSNPDVWQQWLVDVEAILKQDPTRTVFTASPNDSWSKGHCVCDNCRAWDHPDGEPRMMHWNGHPELRPALSDRHVTFANQLAGLLEKRYPKKDYKVMMLSYGHALPVPIAARPADNVIIISVTNFLGRTELVDGGSTWGTKHREHLASWGELDHPLVWRPNTGSPAGWQQGLPDVSIEQTARDIKFAAANHSVGIFIDSVWEHWATQGPQYYVMAQLVWDPAKNSQAVLDDYYRRAFGPAMDDIRSYYEEIESIRQAYVGSYGYGSGTFNLPNLFTVELLRESEERLERARVAVEKSPKIYRQRVEFVQLGLTYTRLLLDNINAMKSYWQDKDDELARNVLANWDSIMELCNEVAYAINCKSVRPTTQQMRGLHPEHPNPKWKPNRVKDLDLN